MKRTVRTGAACAVIFVLSFGLASAVTGTGGTGEAVTAVSRELVAGGTSDRSPAYTVREHNGVVAVFFRESDAPAVETDIPVEGLRAGDRELIRQGIEAETYTEVLYLLEDLNS